MQVSSTNLCDMQVNLIGWCVGAFVSRDICLVLWLSWPGTHSVDQAGLELTEIHLPLPPWTLIQFSASTWQLTTVCNSNSKESEEKFKVETRTIAVDFTLDDIYDKIKTGLAGLEIGILGLYFCHIYDSFFGFHCTIKKLININVLSVCKVTRLVLPGMVERSKGVIVNISSATGLLPIPLLTVYSATKAFVDFFSQCLHEEYKSKGIFVQSVLPYFVATKLAKIRRPTLDKPSPETFVKSAIKTVGLQSRTTGYVVHALMGSINSILPRWIYFKITMGFNKSLRNHYLKKTKKN
ncbi:Hsd17b12 [Phodopus roborovskii]|uniref:Very-long-chain 3-oxoacyl-CoA reductase n=1 Tax=Phodopus roborovskii TaxID=109678 RepID=A0AAU9Z801_PHORO|nr:Hsd17b12 [Phodopus roborovskii]